MRLCVVKVWENIMQVTHRETITIDADRVVAVMTDVRKHAWLPDDDEDWAPLQRTKIVFTPDATNLIRNAPVDARGDGFIYVDGSYADVSLALDPSLKDRPGALKELNKQEREQYTSFVGKQRLRTIGKAADHTVYEALEQAWDAQDRRFERCFGQDLFPLRTEQRAEKASGATDAED